jgi:LemA protein
MEILIGVAVLALIIYFLMYNSIIAKKNAIENAFSSIDVQLKMRFDLIPSLVETVKQFMAHEKSLLESVTRLRTQSQKAATSNDKIELNNDMAQIAGKIMILSENYPEIKANENFNHLQKVLHDTEAQIAAARRAYNAAVIDLNNAAEMFPTNIIARMMKISKRSVLSATEEERKAPNMKELFK